MNLKNYTTEVPVERTLSMIEHYLAQCDVNGISKQFEKGQPVALFFHLEVGGVKYTIRLPANIARVQECFWKDYCASTTRPRKSKEDFLEQAARTAWKIQQDWVQVQMSLIRMKQVDFLEVFMGFVYDGEQSFYERLQGGGFKQLTQGTHGAH